TQKGPDLAAIHRLQAPEIQVAHVASLISSHQWPQTHGHGGKLPELGHQTWVRVRRQATTSGLTTEVVHLLIVQAPFYISTAINAGGGVALYIDQITVKAFCTAPEKMIKAHVVQDRRRLIGGNVPAHIGMPTSTQHHDHGIPAHI